MGCRACKYSEDFEPICQVTGDRCFFLSPNEKQCFDKFGEGPLSCEEEEE